MTTQCLVIDSATNPHRRASTEDAVSLVLRGKATVVLMHEAVAARVRKATIWARQEMTREWVFSAQMRAWAAACEGDADGDFVMLRVPSVVQLVNVVAGKKQPAFTRLNVMTRDGFRCAYCGERKRMSELTYDHVLPSSRGGKTTWENIVVACVACNGRKGDRTPEEAGMLLRKQPIQPKWLPVIGFHPDRNDPAEWSDFTYWNVPLEA